jgi:hypothetical protein
MVYNKTLTSQGTFGTTGVEDMFIITAIYSSNLELVVSRRKRSGRWL